MRRLLFAIAVPCWFAGVALAQETTRTGEALSGAADRISKTSGSPIPSSRLAEGDATLRKARTRVDRNVGDDDALADLADTLRELALRTPTRSDALGEIGESLSIREGLMDRRAQDPEWVLTLADDYGQYATRLSAAGEHATAIGAQSRRLTILAALQETGRGVAPSAGEIAWEHIALAEMARAIDQPAIAAREDEKALAAFREQLRADYSSADPAARHAAVIGRISSTHQAVAAILVRAGMTEAAVAEHFFGIAAINGGVVLPATGGGLCGHYRSIEAIYAGAGEAAKADAARTVAPGNCPAG